MNVQRTSVGMYIEWRRVAAGIGLSPTSDRRAVADGGAHGAGGGHQLIARVSLQLLRRDVLEHLGDEQGEHSRHVRHRTLQTRTQTR